MKAHALVVITDARKCPSAYISGIRREEIMAQPTRRRKWAVQILASDTAPIEKVRKLVALGYDEEDADTMVSGAQAGPAQSMYYEQLPRPDYPADE